MTEQITGDQITRTKNYKRTLILLAIGLTAVAASGAVLLLGGDTGSSAANLAPAPPITGAPAGDNESAAYRELVAQKNEQMFESARDSGDSMIATLMSADQGASEPDAAEPAGPGALPQLTEQPTEPAGADYTGAAVPERQLNETVAGEIEAIMNSWRLQPHNIVVLRAAVGGETRPAEGPGAASIPAALPERLIQAGARLYASLGLAVNSDYPGAVSARIIGGEFSGATAIGRFNRIQDRVVLEFDQLALPDGRTLDGINAVAVDISAALPSLQGDVDYHFMRNYILPAAARFAVGLGTAAANSGSTIINPVGSVTVNRRLSTNDQLKAAAAEVGRGIIQDVFSGKRPPTVTVDPGARFALFFTKDVYDGDPASNSSQDQS